MRWISINQLKIIEGTEGIEMKYARHVGVCHNEAVNVILQVLTDTLKVDDDLNASLLQHVLTTDTGQLQNFW